MVLRQVVSKYCRGAVEVPPCKVHPLPRETESTLPKRLCTRCETRLRGVLVDSAALAYEVAVAVRVVDAADGGPELVAAQALDGVGGLLAGVGPR